MPRRNEERDVERAIRGRTPKAPKVKNSAPPIPKFTPPKAERAEMSKLRKRVRDKQYRLKKRYGIEAPKPTGTRSWQTEGEFQQQMAELRTYLDPNTAKPVKMGSGEGTFYITREQYERAQELLDQYQRERYDFFREAGVSKVLAGGKEQVETVYEHAEKRGTAYNNIYYTLLNPQTFEPDTFTSAEQFQKWLNRLEYQTNPEYWEAKQQTMYDNFIGAIETISQRSGVDASDLMEAIRRLSVPEFVTLYYRAADDLAQIFYNTPDKLDDLNHIKRIFNTVQSDVNIVLAEGLNDI